MEKVHFIEIDQLTYGISIKESENKLTVFLTNFLHDFWISDVDKNDLPTISKVNKSDLINIFYLKNLVLFLGS